MCLYIKWFYVLLFNTNNSTGPIDGILRGTTTPGQSGPESNGNKSVLHISQCILQLTRLMKKKRSSVNANQLPISQ